MALGALEGLLGLLERLGLLAGGRFGFLEGPCFLKHEVLFDLLGLRRFDEIVHLGFDLCGCGGGGLTRRSHHLVEGGALDALLLNNGFLGLSTCFTGLGLELVLVFRLGSSVDVRIVAGHDGGSLTGAAHLVRLEGRKGFDVRAVFLEMGFPVHANLFATHAPVEGACAAFQGHLSAVVEHQAEGNVALQIGLEVEAWGSVTLGGHGAEAPKVGVFVGVTDAHEAAGHQMGDADDFLGLHHATGRHHAGASQHIGLV